MVLSPIDCRSALQDSDPVAIRRRANQYFGGVITAEITREQLGAMLIELRTQATQLFAQGLRDQAAKLIEKAAELEPPHRETRSKTGTLRNNTLDQNTQFTR